MKIKVECPVCEGDGMIPENVKDWDAEGMVDAKKCPSCDLDGELDLDDLLKRWRAGWLEKLGLPADKVDA